MTPPLPDPADPRSALRESRGLVLGMCIPFRLREIIRNSSCDSMVPVTQAVRGGSGKKAMRPPTSPSHRTISATIPSARVSRPSTVPAYKKASPQ